MAIQTDIPNKSDHEVEKSDKIEYEREAARDGEANNGDGYVEYLEIKEIIIAINTETEDCNFASEYDSLGKHRNSKENMRSYIRKKKQEDTGIVDQI